MKNESKIEHSDDLWSALERLAALASLIVIVALVYFYFQLPHWNILTPQWREFLGAIITNLIPVYVLFVISYVLFRQIQRVKARRDTQVLSDLLADKIRANITRDGAFPTSVASSLSVIKSRDQITLANIELINGAEQSIISFSGDLSWTRRCDEALTDAVTRGVSIRILCKDPLSDKAKGHVKRYLDEAGIEIKYYPKGFDPDVRGIMVDTGTSKRAFFVEKRHRDLGDNYQRLGVEGSSEMFEYWGQYFDTTNGQALISPLAKLFDVLWNEAAHPQVIVGGDWFSIESELSRLRQYRTATISYRSVKVANLKPLHRFIDINEFQRIQQLAVTLDYHNIPLWGPFTSMSQRRVKIVCPPIVEIHDNQQILLDGLARVYHARVKRVSEIFVCAIENVTESLPGTPWTWDKVQIADTSDYDKFDNFQHFDSRYWRELDSLHVALERVTKRT